MIYYVVTAAHAYTMESYLQTWGRPLNDRIKLVFYEELPRIRRLPTGTYIFSDLERLTRAQSLFARHVWEELAHAGPRVRLLNHPIRTMRRYQLLNTLFNMGWNTFRVCRAPGWDTTLRFPVFIRHECEHKGSLTSLLHSPNDVISALADLEQKGHDLQRLMIVEFCDTADASGTYRKYSVFMIGGTIIPRHLIFSRKWVLKTADLGTHEMLQEEREYMKSNPDEHWARQVFALANVQYGRIDYGLLNGRPQVWEINTNPAVLMRPKDYAAIHQAGQAYFARTVQPVFEQLDSPLGSNKVEISAPHELAKMLPMAHWANRSRRFVRNIKNKLLAIPRVGILTRDH